METKTANQMKKWLITLCDFCKFQLETDRCTAEEIKSFYKMAAGNLEVDATTHDIAEYFGQTDHNVANVLSRRLGDKPKRKVYHSLKWFLRQVPEKWL